MGAARGRRRRCARPIEHHALPVPSRYCRWPVPGQIDCARNAQEPAGHLVITTRSPAAIDRQHGIQNDGAIGVKADPVIRENGIRLDRYGGIVLPATMTCTPERRAGYGDVEFLQDSAAVFGPWPPLKGVRGRRSGDCVALAGRTIRTLRALPVSLRHGRTLYQQELCECDWPLTEFVSLTAAASVLP